MIPEVVGGAAKLIKTLGFKEAIILVLLGAIVGIITGVLPNQLNEVGTIKLAIAAHTTRDEEHIRLLRLICLFTAQRAGATSATACITAERSGP